jgi:uncharacterized protein (DUF1330 family)
MGVFYRRARFAVTLAGAGPAVPIITQYGGRYLVSGGKTVPLSGAWNPERLIVIEFGSLDRPQKCFASEEYKRIAPLWLGSTSSRSIIAEGSPE